MSDDMGTFRIDIEIENPARPGERSVIRSVLVDTGAELSWIPATALEALGVEPIKTWQFRQADGTVLERRTGGIALHAAGLKTLEILRRPATYDRLEAVSAKLAAGLAREARKAGTAATINRVGSMLTLFFAAGPVVDFESAKKSRTAAFGAFFRSALDQGVYFPPAQFEAAFVSTAHTDADIETTLHAAGTALGVAASLKVSSKATLG